MSQKRTDKIMDAVLERVSDVISNRYNINKNDIIDNIKNIPESFRCNYTLTKGKRKGQSCGTVLCPHHPEHEYMNFMEISGDEKYDSDIACAIDESIMYANVNDARRAKGLNPLYPITQK